MARRPAKRPEYFDCPSCGAQVRVGAKFCRECGADDELGWNGDEDADAWSSDLPTGYAIGEDEDYDDAWKSDDEVGRERGKLLRYVGFALLLFVAFVVVIGLVFE